MAAHAQQLGDDLPNTPHARTSDGNSVDYMAGFQHWQMPDITIGNGDSALTRTYEYNYDRDTDNFYGAWDVATSENNGSDYFYSFSHPGGVDYFDYSIDPTKNCTSPEPFPFAGNSGTCINHGLTFKFEYITNDQLALLTDRSGTQYTYDQGVGWWGTILWNVPLARLTTIIKPSGEIIKMYFDNLTSIYNDPASVDYTGPITINDNARLRAVVSSYGYMLKYTYATTGSVQDVTPLQSITAINLSVDYCDPTNVDACVLSHPWPTWTFNPTYAEAAGPTNDGWPIFGPLPFTVSSSQTDPLGETYAFTMNQLTFPSGRTITRNPLNSLRHELFTESDPGSNSGGSQTSTMTDDGGDDDGDDLDNPEVDSSSYTGDGMCIFADYRVCVVGQFTVSNGQGTWNYNFNDDNPDGDNYIQSMVITDPLGHARTVNTDGTVGLGFGQDVTSVVDENNNTTSYQYDPTFGFLSQITYPEGNYTTYTYNDRGDLTLKTEVAKSGSGLPNRVVQYVYNSDTYCANPMTCNEPVAEIDANGKETDYTYDPTTGFVLTETAPADSAGVRPQTRYTYTALYPQVLNSSGQLVNAATPIYKLTRTSTCQTATSANPASCVGTAAETVTTYAYNTNNLWLSSKIVAAGDNSVSATINYTYDNMGNLIMQKGPRTDVDDSRYTTYDALRRPVFEIGADPDGSGPLPRVIVHHIYDVDGHEIRTETGTGNATDGSDFVVTSYKTMTYDSYGNLVQTVVAHP